MNSTLVIALLFSAVACQCVASEAVSARVDKLLALMGEDIDFRESARRTMASVVEEGKIPKAVAAEILKEISERDYLAQLGETYISNLSEIEIDEAIAYLEVTANLTVFRGLIAAAAELDGIELATRRKTLATRHPAAWKATEMFSRSERSVKYPGSATIQVL